MLPKRQSDKQISEEFAEKICKTVENYSSYVQQLSWNVLALTEDAVTQVVFKEGLEATMAQVSPLFVEQTSNLSTYQLNFLRAMCRGYHNDFGKKEVAATYNMGSRSNLPKIIKALEEREIIEKRDDGLYLSDPLFKIWFSRYMM